MQTYIIKKNPLAGPNDLETKNFDREIKFARGAEYAVIVHSIHKAKNYTTHKNKSLAIAEGLIHGNHGYKYTILDTMGKKYSIHKIVERKNGKCLIKHELKEKKNWGNNGKKFNGKSVR